MPSLHDVVSGALHTDSRPSGHRRPSVWVRHVTLLGTQVAAVATLDLDEHNRRRELRLGGVTDPLLLDSLINLSGPQPAEDHPELTDVERTRNGIVEWRDDGTIVRILRPVASLEAVVLRARHGHELAAVQAASLFAAYTYRWVEVPVDGIQDVVEMEAKVCGVGLVDASHGVVVEAEPPVDWRFDQWLWMLQEKVYERWLTEQ